MGAGLFTPALLVAVNAGKSATFSSPARWHAACHYSCSGGLEMKSNNLKGKIRGTLIAFSLVLGIGIMSSATAQAQRRNDGQWERRDRNRQERIYRNERRRDDRDGRNNGYGNYGRNRTYGNNGRYGNNGGYNNNQVALNQGYQAGLNTGASDAQRGQSYSPQRSHYYKDASTQAFRDGFVQGYDAGYRQYGGYNNGNYRRGNSSGGIGDILGGIFGRP
jgi:hypothetical protein